MAGRYDLQMVPDPSSPTGFSPRYVYTPATPLDRAREQIGQIGQLVGQLARRGSPIVEGIRSIPARPTLSEALAQPIYDRPSNVPEVTAGQRTAKRTLGERFAQNREDALQRGIAAALQRSVDAPGFDPATERNRREAYDLLSANDPFYADPNPRLAALATGAGQLVGAMQDPTSYIAPGRTILGRAVGGAGVGGATDVIAQALDIGSGVADTYNPLQTAGATVAPALLSLGGDALARAGRGAPEAAAPEPIAPEPLAPVQPRRRGPSVFDYAAYEAANPMPRPFETAPNLPPPRTYEEAVDQVQSLQAQLNEAYRDVGRSTSVQNPGVSGMRSLDRRAVLERQLAAARTELERLRPPAPERVNPPGTSEAARAYLERLGMGRVAELGSTRPGEPQRPSPDQTARTPRPRAERQVIDATAPSRSLLTPEARTTTQIIRNPSQADLLRLSKNGEELRYFKDPDGNVFVGRAFDLTHYDMLQTTGQPNATQSGLEVGVLARDDGNRFSVVVGSGNTPEDQLVSFPMTREWLRGIENTTPTAPEPLAPVTAARPGEPQAMRRGQRPAGDINAQTQALLNAMEQHANDANLQPSGGNATFQIGERRAPGTWPSRQRPRAPEPLGPVQTQQTPRDLPINENRVIAAAQERFKDQVSWRDSLLDMDAFLADAGIKNREGFPANIEGLTDQEAETLSAAARNDGWSFVAPATALPERYTQSIARDTFGIIRPEDLEVSFTDPFDPFVPREDQDFFPAWELRNTNEIKKRLQDRTLETDTPTSLNEAFNHRLHTVRAAAFQQALDDANIEYVMPKNPQAGSEYFIIRPHDPELDATSIKVRFADHARQSNLHERADYNLNTETTDASDVRNALRAILNNPIYNPHAKKKPAG